MKRSLLTVLLITVVSCNSDYSISGSLKQTFDASGIEFLEITCYCPNKIEIEKTGSNSVIAIIDGRSESKGYHGKQPKPKEIRKEIMSFLLERNHDTLVLTSKEWTYIHHSFIIEDLKLVLPNHIDYGIVRLTLDELDGREVK